MNDDEPISPYISVQGQLLGQWVTERMHEVLLKKPWSRESARAFADMLREFEPFAAENAPSLDPVFLPWLLFMMGHADRLPTGEEIAEAVTEFERVTVH
jgi:hypothetical protein